MDNNIKSDTQKLIKKFEKTTAGDKSKAMVIISTSLEVGHEGKLLLACAGTGSKLLNIQATALVETFSHLVENGTIKNPQIEMINLITGLNQSLSLAASGADHGKD